MASLGGVGESIACRTSKLNQMFQGRKLTSDQKSIVGREGLLDALFVLYDECSSECLMKNEYIAEFVNKCMYDDKNVSYLLEAFKCFSKGVYSSNPL